LNGISLPFLPTIGQNIVSSPSQSQTTGPSSGAPGEPGKEATDVASALHGAQNYALGHPKEFGQCSDRGLSGVVGFYLFNHGVSQAEMQSSAMQDAFGNAHLNYRVGYAAYLAYAGLGGEFSDKTYSSFNHCIKG
ncbi:MAG TPA: hypothetical protein VNG90_05800, partial [Candidatus Acidoferrum sp.]|nr:hypothetical protein [Candidatus Acidoferrum sp.]